MRIFLSQGLRDNQEYVAGFVPTFVKQIGLTMGAERVMTALMKGNVVLIEALPAVHVRAVKKAFESFGKQAVFVDFLTALCANDGKVRILFGL